MNHYITRKQFAPWLFLIVFAALCYFSQDEKSVTVDEFCHFPSGIYNLITLDWRMDRESPPLVKCFPALTAIITQPDLNIRLFAKNPNPWTFGYDFMFRNMEEYQKIFKYGRCAVILLGCLGGFILFKFANELFGYKAGLLALFLYIFNPNIIAHSRLTTIDVGASCFILLSIYCFWLFLKKKDGRSTFIAGAALGIAQLSKFTSLLLFPIFLVIFIINLLKEESFLRRRKRTHDNFSLIKYIGYFFLSLLISLLIINAGYLFSGTFTPLEKYHFLSEPLISIKDLCWNKLPIPLPYEYVKGFDSQLAISTGHNSFYVGYLMGENSLKGWWYYYIIAFIIKNPVSLTVLLLITLYIRITGGISSRADFKTSLCIWIPVLCFFSYFSFFTNIPIGIRFMLPVLPLLFMAIGYIAGESIMKHKAAKAIIYILLIFYMLSSVYAFPNYLSYFNPAAVGYRDRGYWLIDSNLDWGQDLPSLKNYMKEKGIKKIKLGYFGRVDPGIYGIDYTLAKKEIEEGFYAISANFLAGRPYYLLKENKKGLKYADIDYFRNYRLIQPNEILGHTIYVFEVNNKKGAVPANNLQ